MVETIFILDEHLKTSKALTVNGKNNFFDDCYSMDLSTGVESYEFSTNVEDLDEKNYVMFKYHDEFKLFQITEIEQEHNEGKIITYCYGESACLELLNDVVRAFNGSYNCIQFLQHVLEGTGWSIGNYSSSLEEKTLEIDITKTTQKWSCIQDYMSSYGYELNTRVLYENGRVVAKKLDVFEEGQLGNRTYKRFEYGRNVKGIVKKKDLYEWCTALIIDTDQDIADISFEENTYVKPAGSDVIMAKYENNHYNLGRNFIYANYEDKSSSAGEAIANALAELKRRATPCFDYECTTIMTYEEFDQISLGDTVYVVDHTFNPIVTLEARVGKLEISFSDRNNCKCNLTNYKEIKSRIKAELTGTITEILESYFPLTEDMIAGEAIGKEHLKEDTYEYIRANYIKVDIGKFEKVVTETFVAKDVYAENIEAINGAFKELHANDVTINTLIADEVHARKIAVEKLEAEDAEIRDLKANKADVDILSAKVAGINDLVAGKLDANYFESDEAKIGDLTVGELEAGYGKIEKLEGDFADIDNIVADKVDAVIGDVGLLEGDIADIQFLVSNVAHIDEATFLELTADKVMIQDALIKSAHIDSIDANKITSGTLDTGLLTIQDQEGSMSLKNSLLQFKDHNGTTRIQMGKDAENNFTFLILDETGEGIILNHEGLGEKALRDGLIVDSMVNDNANISGDKLDIDSVVTNINKDGTKQIDSTKIWLGKDEYGNDRPSLGFALDELTTNVGIAMNGFSNVQKDYSTLNATVNQINLKVGTVEESITKQDGDITKLESRISEAESKITPDAITNVVSKTYYNKIETEEHISDAKDETIDRTNSLYANKNEFDVFATKIESQMTQTAANIEMKFTSSYKYATDVESDLENYKEEVATNIRFDAKGIELGKTNSPFKAALSNEKLSFTENGNEVAYISNNKMYITEVEATNSLTIGSRYYWAKDDNSHLRLRLGRD